MLKNKSKPNLDAENKFFNKIVSGVDEAGRDSWAGPLVAASVTFIDKKTLQII